jgi:5-oxoprolinase (ATP-hydrolysing)
MTNTRITDVEVLERRHPVRVERFEVREGSGGAGRHRGGDGIVRAYRFLAPLTLSIVSQRRREGPSGLAGGSRGAPGRQTLVAASGVFETLAAVDVRDVDVGDLLILETPGGGGFGDARDRVPGDRS